MIDREFNADEGAQPGRRGLSDQKDWLGGGGYDRIQSGATKGEGDSFLLVAAISCALRHVTRRYCLPECR